MGFMDLKDLLGGAVSVNVVGKNYHALPWFLPRWWVALTPGFPLLVLDGIELGALIFRQVVQESSPVTLLKSK